MPQTRGSASAYALLLLLLLLLQLSSYSASSSSSSSSSTVYRERNINYIKSSCNATIYRRLCYRSLSIYASKIKANPRLLAHTALNVTLTAARSTSRMIRKMSKYPWLKPREAVAMADCVEEIGDSVDELQKSIGEMNHINCSNFDLTMNDVLTWVSAALTDEDTCMDGFEGDAMNGFVKTTVSRRIVKLAHLTSNALALINIYASTETKPT